MIICKVSQLAILHNGALVADRHWRARLDKLAEEMSITPKRLNEIARVVLQKNVDDVRFLCETDVRKMMNFLKTNYQEISQDCRRIRWEC